jgi:nitrogen fixation/metabolism regulation signal transduction histidine kinase
MLAMAVIAGGSVAALLAATNALPWAAQLVAAGAGAAVAVLIALQIQAVHRGEARARVALATLARLTAPPADLGALAGELAAKVEAERAEAAHRESILAAAVDGAPTCIVLLTESGRVVYANVAARELLSEGAPLEGENFLKLLHNAPAPLRDAFVEESDELFTVEIEGEAETYHLSKKHFPGEREARTLVLVRHLTREIRRQEVDVWKKLIRLLSHELNNSLAPITSLVSSAQRIARTPEHLHKLDPVLSTIAERAAHLSQFLESYARVARLPKPQRTRQDWKEFMGKVAVLAPWAAVGEAPAKAGWFDASQMEQVVLNLLKNAEEAGGPRESVQLEVTPVEGGTHLVVSDLGGGMDAETLSKALLPFYSTKERGSGLGLALCREIVEAHGGKLRLQNRSGGGVTVTCFLPDKDQLPSASQARLTLTAQ